jgi:hypothetical protein
MKTRINDYTRGRGEVVVEPVGENAIILQVTSTYPSSRNTAMRNAWHEGIDVHVDGAIGSLHVEGHVEITASVAMTTKEARQLIAELEEAIA